MSLADAVNAIADEMENDVHRSEEGEEDTFLAGAMKSYAKQLRVAVKASAGTEHLYVSAQPNPLMTPDTQHFLEIEKARQEIRQQRAKATQEEREDIMTSVKGGKSDGTMLPRNPEMPDGAKMRIGGEVYELRKGELHAVIDSKSEIG